MIIKNEEVFANPKAKPVKVDYENLVKENEKIEIEDKIEKKENNKILIVVGSVACVLLVLILASIITLSLKPKEVANNVEIDPSTNVSNNLENKVLTTEEEKNDFINKINESIKDDKEGMNLTFLGDIMMGGPSFKKITEAYSLSFKDIAYMTSKADYTIANFTTVIDESNPENTYNKYVTSKSAISALKALGVDIVNLANDHILDYGELILQNTKKILKENNFLTYGVGDSICYLQKNDIKIGMVTANDVVIGTRSTYENAGVAMYSKENLEKQIKEAKENSDMVIVSLHYGLENKHVVTNKMKEMAKHAIDSGADMVVGHHAMGVLPVEIYNGKPILYSIGHLISDVKSEYARQTATIDIEISKDYKVKKIVMNPVYITETETVKAEGYKLVQFLEDLEKGCKELDTPVAIENDKVVINLN